MESVHEKILESIKDFINQPEIKSVLSSSEVETPSFYLLNPQLSLTFYLDRDMTLIAKANGNGNDGITEFKKSYQIAKKKGLFKK